MATWVILWGKIYPVNSFDEAAEHLEAAGEFIRAAHTKLPIGWDEELNLIQVASSLELIGDAVRRKERKAANAAKRAIITRKEAAGIIGSFSGREGEDSVKYREMKERNAKNASMARRENAILKKNGPELREILAVARSGRLLKEVADEYWIREKTLEAWLEAYQQTKLIGDDQSSG